MASILSNYAGNLALQTLFAGDVWLALFVAPGPGPTADFSTEVAGAGYVRQKMPFSTPTGKTVVSTAAFVFPAMPACTVAYLGACDAIGGGHLLALAQLGTPIPVAASGQLRGAAGDVAFSL